MSGLLPPPALSARIGLKQVAAAQSADEALTLTRERPREYAALARALERTDQAAPCAGDARYTIDRPRDLSTRDVDEMRSACLSCPVSSECDAYAAAARPTAGFWAGRQYPQRTETPAG